MITPWTERDTQIPLEPQLRVSASVVNRTASTSGLRSPPSSDRSARPGEATTGTLAGQRECCLLSCNLIFMCARRYFTSCIDDEHRLFPDDLLRDIPFRYVSGPIFMEDYDDRGSNDSTSMPGNGTSSRLRHASSQQVDGMGLSCSSSSSSSIPGRAPSVDRDTAMSPSPRFPSPGSHVQLPPINLSTAGAVDRQLPPPIAPHRLNSGTSVAHEPTSLHPSSLADCGLPRHTAQPPTHGNQPSLSFAARARASHGQESSQASHNRQYSSGHEDWFMIGPNHYS